MVENLQTYNYWDYTIPTLTINDYNVQANDLLLGQYGVLNQPAPRVWKDFGIDYFYNFSVDFEINYSVVSGNPSGFSGIWFTQNEQISNYQMLQASDGCGVRVWARTSDPVGTMWFGLFKASPYPEYADMAIQANTTYYCTFIRNSPTLTLEVYQDSARTILLNSLVLTQDANEQLESYRYFYAFAGNGYPWCCEPAPCTCQTIDGGIANIDFGTAPTTWHITTTVSPTGSGSITLNPPGGNYEEGTSVELTATPATGYTFSNWAGYITGSTNPITITMPAQNITITANFTGGGAEPTGACCIDGTCYIYTQADCSSYGGTWIGEGTSCYPDPCGTGGTTYPINVTINPSNAGIVSGAGVYQEGATVTLTATPYTGYKFNGWTGYITDTTNPLIFTMPASTVNITANFIEETTQQQEIPWLIIGIAGAAVGIIMIAVLMRKPAPAPVTRTTY